MAERWVVVTIAHDGTLDVFGPFRDEYTATLWANENETEDSDLTCNVRMIGTPDG